MGEALFEGNEQICKLCHMNNGDGTFGTAGGNMFFDVNNLENTTLDGLADYIAAAMPPTNPALCTGDCAVNIAAYLKTFVGMGSGSSSSSSSSSGSSSSGGSNQPTSVLRGEEYFDEQCAVCHDGTRMTGLFSEESLREKDIYNKADLAAYIDANMPLGNAEACTGTCASDISDYIATWHYLPINPLLATDESMGQIDNPLRSEMCSQEPSAGYRTLRLLTREQYKNSVDHLLGIEFEDVFQLPQDSRSGNYVNNNDLAILRGEIYTAYLGAAEQAAGMAAEANFPTLNCGSNFNETCVEQQLLGEFAKRVLRRELTTDEAATFREMANGMSTEGDIKAGIELAITAMLSSPQFLYRHEIGEASNVGADIFALSSYEMAAWISYTFAKTTPSALPELWQAAENNALQTPDQIRTQLSALLDEPEAETILKEMVNAWLRTERLDNFGKNPELFPNYTDLVPHLREELGLNFANVMLSEGESFASLYAPGATHVNSALANHYGIAPPGGNGFAKVATPERGGLLLSGAFLAAHGDNDEASPIRRAVYVRRDMLCQDMPDPPEGVDVGRNNKAGELGEFLDAPTTTNRMAFHRLTEDGTCLECHAELINPLGFGLEDYDTVGRFRTEDLNGNSINALGALYSPYLDLQFFGDPERDVTYHVFEGGQGLAEMLATGEASELAKSCLAMQVLSFSSGINVASITNSERPEVDKLAAGERNSYACDVEDLVNVLDTASPRSMLETLGTLESVRYRKAWTR